MPHAISDCGFPRENDQNDQKFYVMLQGIAIFSYVFQP